MDSQGEMGLLQRVMPARPVHVTQRTVSSEAELQTALNEFGMTPFDLACGENLRCGLFNLPAATERKQSQSQSQSQPKCILAFCVHHAFFDGMSASLLQRELASLFRGEELDALPLQYLDYAQHENAWLSSEECKAGLEYWKRTLEGAESLVTDLPYDRPSTQQSPEAARVTVTISAPLRAALEKWQAQSNSTLFMTLMASLQLLLHKITQQTDVCVGSYSANRYRPELEGLIGMFVNTLPYRVEIDPKRSFAELQAVVRSTALDVMRHSAVPFDLVVQMFTVWAFNDVAIH